VREWWVVGSIEKEERTKNREQKNKMQNEMVEKEDENGGVVRM